MVERPFLDETAKPAEEAIRSALGPAFACYSALLLLAPGFSAEWTFSRRGGWMLKVFDRKKALFYAIPGTGSFRASLTLREDERLAFLADPGLAVLHPRIEAARRFAEGYALFFDITGEPEFGPLASLVRRLVAVRSTD